MDPRERIDYSAIVDRAPLRFPGDTRIVVWPVFNIENWDTDKPMPRAALTPPGEQLFVPDIPNWSWQEYGMRVGFWRIMKAFQDRDITATLSINASVCDVYPRVAAAAKEAGWEFLPHTYHQMIMHKLDDERDTIRKTLDRIGAFTGKPPKGWLGPGLTQTYDTSDILKEEGVEYVADFLWDDEPTVVKTHAGDLVNIPYSLELNDIPMMLSQHHKASELYDRTLDQFERLYEESADRAKVMGFGIHPYISGVPHRIKYFEAMLDAIRERPGVEFWTGEQILDWFNGTRR
jgi:allantoinase